MKKLPTLQGPARRQSLLRVVDAHVVELRARREAPLGRHAHIKSRRLVGRQGRVAEGHGADARRLRPGRDRHPPPADRRAAARRARDRRAHRERRRRQAPAPDAGAARPLHDPARSSAASKACTSRSSATSCTRASRARSSRRSQLVGVALHARRPAGAACRASFGAEMTTDIGAIRDADVVYVLRMQNERMEEGANFVPSLREYAARWGITPERLRPGQKVMHPGPMNRGVEIDPRVADSADSLVEAQVRSGLVVRMAVLYDVLTGGPGRRARTRRGGGGVMLFGQRAAGRRTSSSAARASSTRPRESTRSLDVRIDDGVIAAVARAGRHERAPRRRRDRARARARVRRSARPSAHAGPRGRGDDRERDGCGGRRRLLRDPRDAEHRSGRRLARRCSARSSRPRAARREVPVGFLAAITRGQDGRRADRDGASSPTPAPSRFSDDGVPVSLGRPDAPRAPVRVDHRAGRSRCTARSRALSRGGHMHEGAVSAELGFAGYPSVAESVMVERDLALAAYEDQPLHLLHLSARRVGRGTAARARARRARERRGDAAPPRPHRRRRALARPEREDEPAAARGAGPRRAARRAARRHDRGDRHRSRAARAPREGRAVRGGAVRRHRPRDRLRRALHASSSSPGLLPLETLLERMSTGPARIFGLERPRIAVGATREPRPPRPRRRVAGDARTGSARARRTRGCSARR